MTRRLLFVSHTAEWTGPTNSLLHLVRHLSDAFEKTVLLPGTGLFSAALEREGVATMSVTSLRRNQILRLRRIVERLGIDLVYCNNTSSGCRNALIAAKLARVPVVWHVRGMGEKHKRGRLAFLRAADAVIAVSEASRKSISRYVNPGRLHVVHNGVDLSAFTAVSRPDGVERRDPAYAGLPPGAKLLVSVGHLCPRKAQHYAVEAMSRIVREVPQAYLLLVGALDRDPEYVAGLRRQVRDLGLDGHVSLAGFRQDVPELLGAADVLLHTAVSEAQGRAVVEAMAAGVPVVAFAVDGVPEMVVSGSTGTLCGVGEVDALSQAVTRLLHDPALCREYGENGRRRASEHFSATVTAQRIERIIIKTMGAASRISRGNSAPSAEIAARSGGGR